MEVCHSIQNSHTLDMRPNSEGISTRSYMHGRPFYELIKHKVAHDETLLLALDIDGCRLCSVSFPSFSS